MNSTKPAVLVTVRIRSLFLFISFYFHFTWLFNPNHFWWHSIASRFLISTLNSSIEGTRKHKLLYRWRGFRTLDSSTEGTRYRCKGLGGISAPWTVPRRATRYRCKCVGGISAPRTTPQLAQDMVLKGGFQHPGQFHRGHKMWLTDYFLFSDSSVL